MVVDVIPANGWNVPASSERIWRIGDVCIEGKECEEITKNTPTVLLTRKAEGKILCMNELYPKIEWIGFMEGVIKGEFYYITDIEIFEQENTTSHTELTSEGDKQLAEWRKTKKCIGWIHSHNDMGVFQSADDKDTANMYDVSITVNNKFEMFCTVKKKLSCGKFALIEVTPLKQVDLPETAFTERAKTLVKEKENSFYNSVRTTNYAYREDEIPLPERQKSLFQSNGKKHICGVCGNKIKVKSLDFCSVCGHPFHVKCMNGDICPYCTHRLSEGEKSAESPNAPVHDRMDAMYRYEREIDDVNGFEYKTPSYIG